MLKWLLTAFVKSINWYSDTNVGGETIMFNKWIRYFNQHRKKVLTICAAIVSFFLVIQFLNNMVKNRKQKELENRVLANEMAQNLINQVGDPVANQTIEKEKVNEISGSTTTNIENEETAIKQFIAYCNEGKVTEAYSMLSERCREEVFQTEEQFRQNYYASKFQTRKVSELLSWMNGPYGRTYRVRLYENLLESGNDELRAIEDYVTVDKIDGKYVLAINNFIGGKKIGKYSSAYGVIVQVNAKDVYSEYEQFNISVKNDTQQSICLDPKENTNATYLIGGTEGNVTSYIHELTEEVLVVKPGEVKTFMIKFNKAYTGKDTTNSIRFTNAVLDYEGYLASENKANYNKKVLLYVNF